MIVMGLPDLLNTALAFELEIDARGWHVVDDGIVYSVFDSGRHSVLDTGSGLVVSVGPMDIMVHPVDTSGTVARRVAAPRQCPICGDEVPLGGTCDRLQCASFLSAEIECGERYRPRAPELRACRVVDDLALYEARSNISD